MNCYTLPIDCLLIALAADMFSHNGYGPGTKAKAQGAGSPRPWPTTPWALVLGPGTICLVADHMWFKGNRQAISKQSMSNIQKVIYLYIRMYIV